MKLRTERHHTLIEERVAIFSDEDPPLYRFLLSIRWDREKPMLVAFMLNPSKADHLVNDPTVQRQCERARRLGFGGLIVLNVFAWRETDRLAMLKVSDPIGHLNDNVILDTLRQASANDWTVMVGWGNEGGHRNRHLRVQELLDTAGVEAMCLKLCANGQPGHPLYVGYDQPLIPWRAKK